MKECSRCKIEKEESDFYKCKANKDELSSWCKDCFKEWQREYNKEYRKKDKFKEYRKKYQQTEKYKKSQKQKNYQYRNTDKYKKYYQEYRKKYYNKIREHLIKIRKTDEFKKYEREYRKTEKYKEYKRNYHKKRRLFDPKFRINCTISSSIYLSLKSKKAGRKWESLTGYTVEDLMAHLESKFEPWMNWDNYGSKEGKWTIDHIKPRSLFNYDCPDDEEFRECWALDNLQPMEFIENIKKGNKYNTIVNF